MKRISIKFDSKKEYNELMKYKIMISVKIDEFNCWNWIRSKHKQGYGNISYNKKNQLAHRVSYQVFIGDINDKINILHKCDNPCCVNPDHLFIGTQLDNINDCIKKNRFKRNIPLTRRNKLNYDQVLEIKSLYSKGKSRKDLQNMYNVSQTCIGKILRGESWKINWTAMQEL